MYGLLNRVTRVFSANAHSAVDRAERPEAMLNQLQRELVEAATRAGLALNQALAWRRQVEQRRQEAEHQAREAGAAARQALRDGNEDMARAAITRKQAREAERDTLSRQLERADAVVDRQRERQQRLRDELKGLREKRAVLIQRSRFARSIQTLGSVCEELPEPVSEVVQRMEEKVNAEEAMVDVLTGDDTGVRDEPGLDEYMRDQRVDAELDRLKSELNEGETK